MLWTFLFKNLSKRQIKYDCSLGSFTDRHTKWSMVIARVHTSSCFISQSLPLGISSHTQRGKFSIMLGQNWLPRNIESAKMISPWLAVMASVNVGVPVSNGFRAHTFPKELFPREFSEEVGVYMRNPGIIWVYLGVSLSSTENERNAASGLLLLGWPWVRKGTALQGASSCFVNQL